MGLFDLFSKENRSERSIKRYAAKAIHKHIQSPDRLRALEELYHAGQNGNEDAIYAMLKRFSFVYDKTIEDEQEKEWLYDALKALGEKALPPVKRYLSAADSISWPLRVLEKIATPEEIFATLEKLIEQHEPGYERDPSVKQQLMSFIADFKDPRGVAMITPYLADMDETVRFTAIEALFKLRDPASREPLCAHFVSDTEDSLRIRVRIAEGFAELGWDVVGFRGTFEKLLPEGFFLDKQGKVKRKARGDE
ncbi:MAG TPA: HEAT repeat domain-containing protein [Polyangia bacterium]